MFEVGDTGFDWADIVEEVVSRAGGQTATADDVDKVRRGMSLLLIDWQNKGYNTWRVREMSVGIAGVSVELPLPRSVEEVINVSSRRFGVPGAAQSTMRRISEAEYAALAVKGTRGQPSQYCLRKSDPPLLRVYPIGDRGMWEVIAVYVERPARMSRLDDLEDGQVPGRWLLALITGLAEDLAKKRATRDEALIKRLKGEYDEAFSDARTADRGRQRFRYRI